MNTWGFSNNSAFDTLILKLAIFPKIRGINHQRIFINTRLGIHPSFKNRKRYYFPSTSFNLFNGNRTRLLVDLRGLDTLLMRKNLFALSNVVGAAKQRIDLLERDLLSLRNEEEDEYCQQEIDSSKHVECVEATVIQEDGEKLLENSVGNILRLRSHTNGLSANVHREDFGSPNPNGSTP